MSLSRVHMTLPTRIHADDIRIALDRIAEEIAQKHKQTEHLVIIGVANGGIAVADRLMSRLKPIFGGHINAGVVNITFHRDDIMLRPITAETMHTDIEADLDDARVVLVDDVLYSGRTIRAAINECFDQGRPERIELAVLIDRLDTKLPIHPDYVGFEYHTDEVCKLNVHLDEKDPIRDTISFIRK